MSRLVTKPTKWHVHPVWSESSLSAWRKLEHTAKTLSRLGRCPGWSESSLGAHAILLVSSWGGSIILGVPISRGFTVDFSWITAVFYTHQSSQVSQTYQHSEPHLYHPSHPEITITRHCNNFLILWFKHCIMDVAVSTKTGILGGGGLHVVVPRLLFLLSML